MKTFPVSISSRVPWGLHFSKMSAVSSDSGMCYIFGYPGVYPYCVAVHPFSAQSPIFSCRPAESHPFWWRNAAVAAAGCLADSVLRPLAPFLWFWPAIWRVQPLPSDGKDTENKY